ncbi:MAG: PD-(D/E)XK nuclease family protein [Nanoarchaeota archaeon]
MSDKKVTTQTAAKANLTVQAARIQSPSSINTYRHCPRKYYYNYIAELPKKKSIPLIKGSIIHEVLEDFFDLNPEYMTADFKQFLRKETMRLFFMKWKNYQKEIEEMGIENKAVHAEDCMLMLSNWTEWFISEVEKKESKGVAPADAFRALTPIREQEYRSEEHAVRGFIDAIHEEDGCVRVIDYKTSSRDEVSEEYLLQLSIYALLYRVRHGRLPDIVGLHLLRHGRRELEVTESMVEFATREIHHVHKNTLSKEKKDYVKKIGPLCKWSTGQCDFYDTCIKDA